jgi:hypothetical protein
MKILAVSALALLCSMPAFSQSTDAPKTDSKGGKMMSMTGCISEKDGKYMMMNKQHPDGVMLMTSDDMKAHVGQKMKVMGMMDNSKDHMGMKTTSMKMMSSTCDPAK